MNQCTKRASWKCPTISVQLLPLTVGFPGRRRTHLYCPPITTRSIALSFAFVALATTASAATVIPLASTMDPDGGLTIRRAAVGRIQINLGDGTIPGDRDGRWNPDDLSAAVGGALDSTQLALKLNPKLWTGIELDKSATGKLSALLENPSIRSGSRVVRRGSSWTGLLTKYSYLILIDRSKQRF